MRRMLLVALFAALFLAACGGSSAELTIAAPPQSSEITSSDNAKTQQVIDAWKSTVKQQVTTASQPIKAETVKETFYQSSASLQDIATYYDTLTTKGWTKTTNMPDLQSNTLVSGYESGVNDFVVAAVDQSQLGGEGVLIYTIQGNR